MLRPLAALSFALFALPSLAAPQVASVTKVATVDHAAGAQLRIDMNAAPVFSTRGQASPPKLFITLPGSQAKARTIAAPHPLVKTIKMASTADKNGVVSTVTVALTQALTYDVHTEGRTLVVTFNGGSASTWGNRALLEAASKRHQKPVKLAALSTASSATTRADFGGTHRQIRLAQDDGAAGAGTDDDEEEFEEEADDGATGETSMTYVGFRDNSSVSQVFVRLNKRNAKYSVKREGDNLLVLEITDASIPLRNNRNHLDATYFDSPVKMITPTEVTSSTPKIRIVIEMNNNVPYEDTRDGVDIVLSFRK